MRRVDPHDRKLSLAEVTAEDMAADAAQGGETAGDFIARQTENSNARLGDVLGDLSAKLGHTTTSIPPTAMAQMKAKLASVGTIPAGLFG